MAKIAVYAGSFDPPTLGHLDVIRRVVPHFEKVHVVIAENPKKQSLFSTSERRDLLADCLRDFGTKIEIFSHKGLIVDYCRIAGAKVLIRGLRAVSDFESELQMASMNRRLESQIETFHVMTDEKFLFVSSSLVKEIAQFGGRLGELVPNGVEAALRKKFISNPIGGPQP